MQASSAGCNRDADVLLAVCARFGSPGPKLIAGMPKRGEPGDVGPAQLGPRRPPTAPTKSAAAGSVEAGQRAPGGVGDLSVTPAASAGEHLAHVGLGLVLVRSGAKR